MVKKNQIRKNEKKIDRVSLDVFVDTNPNKIFNRMDQTNRVWKEEIFHEQKRSR